MTRNNVFTTVSCVMATTHKHDRGRHWRHGRTRRNTRSHKVHPTPAQNPTPRLHTHIGGNITSCRKRWHARNGTNRETCESMAQCSHPDHDMTGRPNNRGNARLLLGAIGSQGALSNFWPKNKGRKQFLANMCTTKTKKP